MDLKDFYKTIRDLESGIEEAFPLIVSFTTTNGGRAGVVTEVTRYAAARAIVEGRARLADAAESAAHRAESERQRLALQEQEAKHKLSVTVISAADLREIQGAVGIKK